MDVVHVKVELKRQIHQSGQEKIIINILMCNNIPVYECIENILIKDDYPVEKKNNLLHLDVNYNYIQWITDLKLKCTNILFENAPEEMMDIFIRGVQKKYSKKELYDYVCYLHELPKKFMEGSITLEQINKEGMYYINEVSRITNPDQSATQFLRDIYKEILPPPSIINVNEYLNTLYT
jgi:hypothetical protein